MYFQPLTHFYREGKSLILKSPIKVSIYSFKSDDQAMAQMEYFPQYVPKKVTNINIIIFSLIALIMYFALSTLFGVGYTVPKNFFLNTVQQYATILFLLGLFILIKSFIHYTQVSAYNKLKTQIKTSLSCKLEKEISILKVKDNFSFNNKFLENPFLQLTIILNVFVFILFSQFAYDLLSQIIILFILIVDTLITSIVKANFGLIYGVENFVQAAQKYNDEGVRNTKLN
jgi:hypothetical protein